MMVGNLVVDAGFGNWNFRWETSGSVVASMSRSALATAGRGYVQLCPELIEKYTVAEMRQVVLRLMIQIRAGKTDAEEHWVAPRGSATKMSTVDRTEPSTADENSVKLDA
jgi:hypothetical protein